MPVTKQNHPRIALLQAVQDYVPATIFCASDHLCTLLCKNNYIRKTQGTDRCGQTVGILAS
eukprot:1159221-Pelagomonas_calceolata.AAC.2